MYHSFFIHKINNKLYYSILFIFFHKLFSDRQKFYSVRNEEIGCVERKEFLLLEIIASIFQDIQTENNYNRNMCS